MPIKDTLTGVLHHRRLPVILALVATLLCAPSLWIGWQSDDHAHRMTMTGKGELLGIDAGWWELFSFVNGDPARNHRLMDIGIFPWWTFEGLRLSFFRPLTCLTHWVDYQLWPAWPVLMHVHSLLWFGAVVALATVLYRRVMGATTAAGLAALLFALDDAHGLPAGWLANRNALLASVFGLLALLAHDRWRRDGWRAGVVLGPTALACGLASGELALGVTGYLFAYACFLDRAARLRRFAALVPYVLVVAIWAVVYRALKHGAFGSTWYIEPLREPLRFAGAVVERGPVLLASQFGFVAADLDMLLGAIVGKLFWLGALTFLVVLTRVAAGRLRHDPVAKFWLVGMLLAVVPGCATLPMDRLLYLVGLGGMGLVAQFLSSLSTGVALPRPGRLPRATAGLLVVLHLVVSPVSLPYRAWSAALIGGLLSAAPDRLPDDPVVAQQDVIIVNPPGAFATGFYLPALRALRNQPIPAHTRVLASGTEAIELHRPDARTLVVRPEGGFLVRPARATGWAAQISARNLMRTFDLLLRDEGHPMSLGHRVDLTGVEIEVTAVRPDGRAAEATFRFARPLEDASLRWFVWEDGAFTEWTPLPVGATVLLPVARVSLGPFGVRAAH